MDKTELIAFLSDGLVDADRAEKARTELRNALNELASRAMSLDSAYDRATAEQIAEAEAEVDEARESIIEAVMKGLEILGTAPTP